MVDKSKRPKVILRRCDAPDPVRVAAIVKEGFEELGIRPHGRVLIKPNVVTANKKYIHHSFTHPGVTEGIVSTLRGFGEVNDITIGESSAFGIPPGLFAHEAGYDKLAARIGVRLVDFNQDASDWTELKRAKYQTAFNVPRSISRADFKIWAPKLKYHICCQVTNALKLNIGILQHRDRMACHDDRLDDKIVDLLEIGWPDVVVTDATVIGHGFESAPQAFPSASFSSRTTRSQRTQSRASRSATSRRRSNIYAKRTSAATALFRSATLM